MPNKYAKKKGWKLRKQKYKVSNWSDYNAVLRQRGNIEMWIAKDAADYWYAKERVYDGSGTPKKYTDGAIIACHQIRQVYQLPLRQCQGFMDSLFKIYGLPLQCPDYSCLSKRLSRLSLSSPRYKKTDTVDPNIAAIAFDSTGLRVFTHDEWQHEKHGIQLKKSCRKLHIAVDAHHIIHASELTDRLTSDECCVENLSKQISYEVGHISSDGAYDRHHVYETLSDHFQNADIVIPPKNSAVFNKDNHAQRNRNLQEIKTFGRMVWQKVRDYGRRNYSELAIFRYKNILGTALHARELSRQKSETMIGCSILNKMTGIGMPKSYRIA